MTSMPIITTIRTDATPKSASITSRSAVAHPVAKFFVVASAYLYSADTTMPITVFKNRMGYVRGLSSPFPNCDKCPPRTKKMPALSTAPHEKSARLRPKLCSDFRNWVAFALRAVALDTTVQRSKKVLKSQRGQAVQTGETDTSQSSIVPPCMQVQGTRG